MTEYAQFCALARAAEVLGERWTLLIIRELYLGPKRFSDLSARLRPIAPGVLNGRLRALERRGVIARTEIGPPTPARLYELTAAGRALEPALFELLRWGARYLFPERPNERFEADWLAMVLRAYTQPGPSPSGRIALQIEGDDQPAVMIAGGEEGTIIHFAGQLSAEAPDATIETSVSGAMGLMSARLDLDDAIERKLARVSGSLELARGFPVYFTGAH